MTTKKFKIEGGVTPPPPLRKYPFDQMKIGDSFEVSDDLWERVSTAAGAYGRYHNKKFSIRKHNGAYRCWRIA